MLKKVDHPNIVKYFETYENEAFLYLVMELCAGGELLKPKSHSGKKKTYTEKESANIMYKCL